MNKPIRHYGKWRIRWIDSQGKRRSKVFSAYEEAEYQLHKAEVEAEQIKRGLIRPGQYKHFSELADYWLTKRAVHKRSKKDDISILRKHLLPDFAEMPLASIGVEVVDQYRSRKTSLHPKTLHNHLTLLISMLNVAKDLGWLEEVPRIRKPKINLMSTEYSYLRNDEEIARFLRAAHDEGERVYCLYVSAIYTGMREGELAGLTWGDIDFEKRLITVQRGFDGPTKNGEIRYVPILDPLLPVLQHWRLRNPWVHVFPSAKGTKLRPSARIFQEVLQRILQRAGFPQRQTPNRRKHYLVFHDLRHTFASLWAGRSGDMYKLQKLLGHKSQTMTMRYSHLHPDTFSAEYSRLGTANHITPGKLLHLPTSS